MRTPEMDGAHAWAKSLSRQHSCQAEHPSSAGMAFDSFVHSAHRAVVFGSISPWVEFTLLEHGLPNVTTLDYNTPIIRGFPHVRTLRHHMLPQLAAAFDLAVSFSGIEHDGLTRYGDPGGPNGDMHAMSEIRSVLAPGGHLLLGVPIAPVGDVVYPLHRLYGPARLRRLFAGWEHLGTIWDRNVTKGIAIEFRDPVPFDPSQSWKYQPVFVLRRLG